MQSSLLAMWTQAEVWIICLSWVIWRSVFDVERLETSDDSRNITEDISRGIRRCICTLKFFTQLKVQLLLQINNLIEGKQQYQHSLVEKIASLTKKKLRCSNTPSAPAIRPVSLMELKIRIVINFKGHGILEIIFLVASYWDNSRNILSSCYSDIHWSARTLKPLA